jgi:hypothetical protein
VSPNDDNAAFERFLNGKQSGADFRHWDHVRVAYGILGRFPFPEAAWLYTRELRAIATRAGRPGVYHETTTVAFLSLISEHMSGRTYKSFDAFIGVNEGLLDKAVLLRWYSPERLESDMARQTFLLPEPALRGR